MKSEIIATIISIVCTIIAIITGYYIYIRKKIQEHAIDAINKAEDTDKHGKEKLNEAVDTLYEFVPVVIRPLLSKDILRKIIQKVFDKVEEYAKKQLEKKN